LRFAAGYSQCCRERGCGTRNRNLYLLSIALLTIGKLNIMITQKINCYFLFLLLSIFLVAGCGQSSLIEIRGTVEYDGKPLPIGSVQFIPRLDVKNPQAISTSCEINNGHFHLVKKFGIASGTYDVCISGFDGKPTTEIDHTDEESKPNLLGKPLFANYSFVHVFDHENNEMKIIVPKTSLSRKDFSDH
jgi:hypothetical protein